MLNYAKRVLIGQILFVVLTLIGVFGGVILFFVSEGATAWVGGPALFIGGPVVGALVYLRSCFTVRNSGARQ